MAPHQPPQPPPGQQHDAPAPAPLPLGIYARVSTPGQAREGTSLENQELMGHRKAARLGARVARVYRDPGVSGALYLARPGLQAALADIEAGRIGGLIVADMSRYSRDREHQARIRERVEAAGGRLLFCDLEFAWDEEEGALTPEAELHFHIQGDIAHYERAHKRLATMRGRRALARQGIQPARAQHPYGYHVVTRADVMAGRHPLDALGRYQIVEGQAAWVRQMYRLAAAGASLRDICRHLQERGVPAPRGGPWWYQQTVRHILARPLNKGEAVFGATQRRAQDPPAEGAGAGCCACVAAPPGRAFRCPPRPSWSRPVAGRAAAAAPAPVRGGRRAAPGRPAGRPGALPRLAAGRWRPTARRAGATAWRCRPALDRAYQGREGCGLRRVRADAVEAMVRHALGRWPRGPRAPGARCTGCRSRTGTRCRRPNGAGALGRAAGAPAGARAGGAGGHAGGGGGGDEPRFFRERLALLGAGAPVASGPGGGGGAGAPPLPLSRPARRVRWRSCRPVWRRPWTRPTCPR